ncbi:alpha-L-rhamnosidase C-terminal domain-containing protein [Micromonospora sp. KLBMP9576]|uniref:alpha-L-rhamnosidase-related protein n=1 Tax=Micromonospora sp. KLBMP9576 TaxID=3424769 RepID=UPI003D8C2982
MRRLSVRRSASLIICSALAAALLPAVAAPGQVARATAGQRARVVAAPPPGAIEALNLSPTSRVVRPTAIYRTTGAVANPQNVLSGLATRLTGTNSSITLDFGKEVGGLATLTFGAASDGGQRLGLAFTESSLFVGNDSDTSATHEGRGDGALTAAAPANGTYTMPAEYLRGGFRYLTVFLRTPGWVDLTRVSLNFTAAPGKANPADYANYFYSNDDLLNRIWYGGAYTVQLNTIASHQGRAWPAPATLWNNAAVAGVGTAILSDAAKRDRNVWPGDLGIATPTAYASTNEMESTRNALTTLYNMQNASGELPYAGPPFNLWGSDTYHLWTLNVSATYYNYTADKAWLDSVWPRFTRAMTYIAAKTDGTGLVNVTNTADWARNGQGGLNLQANALMYATLVGATRLATTQGDSTLATAYANRAAALRAAANSRLWDATAGMYRDNPTSSVHPQDGNSMAVWYGLTDTTAKNTSIVRRLAQRWNAYGATTPEWGGDVHPFPGSMEVHAHFTANDDDTALAQIRRTWGHMLDSPIGTKSTMWEGISATGGLAYNPSFMSLAHGWSTGPTSALTFHVLGTAPEPTIGHYRFVPHPGDLTSVEGRITMPQGAVDAAWSRNPSAGTFAAQITSPAGTTGRVGIPKLTGDITVLVNGAVVWSNGTFHPRPGIGGGTQDARYVYLTGVTPGSYTFTATGLGNPPPTPAGIDLPVGFTRCAAENAQCSFSGTRVVAYGAGTYTYRTVTDGTACTSTAFNADPAANLVKSCYVAPLGGPSGYTRCAAEDGTCGFAGTRNVAYGANGAFRHRLAVDGTACTNEVFGDPLDHTAKACYLPPGGGPAGGWTQCAAEFGTCAAANGQPVAYGANGAFAYRTATGDISCTNATFGDPIDRTVKACYWRTTGGPGGYDTACAAETGTCTFSGQQTVAYGARGRYTYRSFTGSAACSTAAFGGDPLPGVPKSCYLTR